MTNESVFQLLNNFAFQNQFIDALIIFGAEGLGWFLTGGLIVFLFRERWEDTRLFFAPSRRHAKELTVIFSTTLSAWGLAELLKTFVLFNPRPYEVLQNVNVLLTNGTMDSFPSGHATFFFALAASLYFYHKKLAYWYFAGAFLIGLSRVVAGAHWPLDILGGAILGGLVASVAYLFCKRKDVQRTI